MLHLLPAFNFMCCPKKNYAEVIMYFSEQIKMLRATFYCCLVSSFGLLVSFQLVIGILQHFSIVLVSYKSLVFLLV